MSNYPSLHLVTKAKNEGLRETKSHTSLEFKNYENTNLICTVYTKISNEVPQSSYYYSIYQSANSNKISKSTGLKKPRE